MFEYNAKIIWINIGWLIIKMYKFPNVAYIAVTVLFHSCFPELGLRKLIKTGSRISSGKHVNTRQHSA